MEQEYIVLTVPRHTETAHLDSNYYDDTDGFQGPTLETSGAAAPQEFEIKKLEEDEIADVAEKDTIYAKVPNDMLVRLIEPVAHEGESDATESGWGIKAVRADVSKYTGSGITVAVLDTGIDKHHPAFNGITLTEQDFTGQGNGDRHGHGTHCAGTIFGRDVNGTRIGIARGITEAKIGKVIGNDGKGTSEMIVSGMKWALEQNVDVISMSLGVDFPEYVKVLVDKGLDQKAAVSRGLVDYRELIRLIDKLVDLMNHNAAIGKKSPIVVAAAGNESSHPDIKIAVGIPAAGEGIISVGALEQTSNGLKVAKFSNIDPKVSAPGVGILSAAIGGGLVSLSGTSMACPHVAGVAALWIEHETTDGVVAPELRESATAKLRSSARYEGFAPKFKRLNTGAGIVQSP